MTWISDNESVHIIPLFVVDSVREVIISQMANSSADNTEKSDGNGYE